MNGNPKKILVATDGSGDSVSAVHRAVGLARAFDAEVVALAEEIGADLIVAGGRGTSPLRRPIGSVSGSIAAHAHCPVLVVRG